MIRSIKERRKELRLTQTELAYIVGVSRNTISSLERGEYNAGILLALKLDYVFGYGTVFPVGGYELDPFDVEELENRVSQVFDGSWLWLRKDKYDSRK